jgi:hypothetical protein
MVPPAKPLHQENNKFKHLGLLAEKATTGTSIDLG